MNIALETLLAKLPIEQINETVHQHIEPLLCLMPEKRMGRVAELIILGILGGQTPVITGMARQSAKDEGETWAVAKRMYRWFDNERIGSQDVFAGLYQIGQQVVAQLRKGCRLFCGNLSRPRPSVNRVMGDIG